MVLLFCCCAFFYYNMQLLHCPTDYEKLMKSKCWGFRRYSDINHEEWLWESWHLEICCNMHQMTTEFNVGASSFTFNILKYVYFVLLHIACCQIYFCLSKWFIQTYFGDLLMCVCCLHIFRNINVNWQKWLRSGRSCGHVSTTFQRDFTTLQTEVYSPVIRLSCYWNILMPLLNVWWVTLSYFVVESVCSII